MGVYEIENRYREQITRGFAVRHAYDAQKRSGPLRGKYGEIRFCTGRHCVRNGNPVLDSDFPVFSTECDRSHVGILRVRGRVVRIPGEES